MIVPRRWRAGWTRVLVLGSLAACIAVPAGSSVALAQPTYTLDKDPIRLGRKAFEAGRLTEAAAAFQEALAASYQVHKAAFGLAEIAVRQGRLSEALDFYHRAVEEGARASKGGYPEARAGLGLLLLRQGKDDEAEREIDAALAGDPDLWPAVYGRALLLLRRERWDEAKALLDRGSRRKGGKEGEDLYHHGMALYWLGKEKPAEAEKEALLALAQNPADPDHAMLVGRVYQTRDTPALAIDAFESALAAPGSAPAAPALHQLGRLYEAVGRHNDARDRYLRAVEVDSTYAPALRDLADLYRRGNQHDRAARTYLRYLTVEPNDVDALLGFSAACLETGRIDEAMGAATTAMGIDSTRVDVRLALVRSGIRNRDPAEKAEAARLAEGLPDSLDWTSQDHSLLAAFDVEAGRYDRAGRHLEQALALDPASADAQFQRGILALRTDNPPAAVAAFEKAIALAPDQPLYPLNLGIAHLQARQTREAIAPLRRALALDPELTIGHLLLAQALAAADSVRAAEGEYRKVLEKEPRNAKALRGLGYCAIQRQDYREAADAYRKAADAEPGSADSWAGLGNAYLGLNDLAAADAAFRRAQAIDPGNPTLKRGLELLRRAQGSSKN